MSEYYAYANDSEEEEIMQLEYEKECMKNYPLTWELDSTTGVRVKTHDEGCQPPEKSTKVQSTTNIWAHFKQKKIKCD